MMLTKEVVHKLKQQLLRNDVSVELYGFQMA